MSSNRSIIYWAATGLFCLQMSFTAYAQLRLPQVAQSFAHLGFPDYFRVELALAKLIGVALLLAPVPARVKEWAYAGFGITFIAAAVSHWAVDGFSGQTIFPLVLLAILAVSYVQYHKKQEVFRVVPA